MDRFNDIPLPASSALAYLLLDASFRLSFGMDDTRRAQEESLPSTSNSATESAAADALHVDEGCLIFTDDDIRGSCGSGRTPTKAWAAGINRRRRCPLMLRV